MLGSGKEKRIKHNVAFTNVFKIMNDDDYRCAASIAIILLLCGIGLLVWVISGI
jgi:ABC-type sulfate transport system permease component